MWEIRLLEEQFSGDIHAKGMTGTGKGCIFWVNGKELVLPRNSEYLLLKHAEPNNYCP